MRKSVILSEAKKLHEFAGPEPQILRFAQNDSATDFFSRLPGAALPGL